MKKALLYLLIFIFSYSVSGQDVYVKAEYPAVVNSGDQFTVMWTVNAGGGEFSAPSFNGFYKLYGSANILQFKHPNYKRKNVK